MSWERGYQDHRYEPSGASGKYQNLVKLGIENLFQQGPKETPMEFLNFWTNFEMKWREKKKKTENLDLASENKQRKLASLFLGQSAPDITKKLS